ncbi:MAG TPA: hypothetical protein VLH86_03030 [Patescibacteria group bacterium]|nr:hypothetical protein [Patescibacteria group bacterium]
MPAKKPKPTRGTPITDHGAYWTRPTAKPKSRPMPSLGQLGQ